MPHYIVSLPFRVQSITPVYHGGYGHRHRKKDNNMQNRFTIDEKETDFKSEMAKITVNPDADSNQQEQQEEKYGQEVSKAERKQRKSFALEPLEFISQVNRISLKAPQRSKNF